MLCLLESSITLWLFHEETMVGLGEIAWGRRQIEREREMGRDIGGRAPALQL